MNHQQQEISQRAWINELLHRMTVASTREVRVQLCAETKQAIAELQLPNRERDPLREEVEALMAAVDALNIYEVIQLRELAQAWAAKRSESVGFKG